MVSGRDRNSQGATRLSTHYPRPRSSGPGSEPPAEPPPAFPVPGLCLAPRLPLPAPLGRGADRSRPPALPCLYCTVARKEAGPPPGVRRADGPGFGAVRDEQTPSQRLGARGRRGCSAFYAKSLEPSSPVQDARGILGRLRRLPPRRLDQAAARSECTGAILRPYPP